MNLPSMLESILLRDLRALRRELESYPDESMIWTLPPGIPNSAGTLALHLVGNLQNFIGTRLGESGYIRDRDAEFSKRDVPREWILAEIDAAENAIRAALPHLDEARLAEEFPERPGGYAVSTADMLLGLAVHLGYHLGQISYHRRFVTGDPAGVGALSIAELSTARR
jgi:hypothetical protein